VVASAEPYIPISIDTKKEELSDPSDSIVLRSASSLWSIQTPPPAYQSGLRSSLRTASINVSAISVVDSPSPRGSPAGSVRSGNDGSGSSAVTLAEESANIVEVDLKVEPPSTEVEKGLWWDGYEQEEIAEKTQGKWSRNLRHKIFTLYRRLFTVVFVTNMAILVSIAVKGGADSKEIGQIVVANIFVSILMRQDHVVNAFFAVRILSFFFLAVLKLLV
jgi:hypothetical protein